MRTDLAEEASGLGALLTCFAGRNVSMSRAESVCSCHIKYDAVGSEGLVMMMVGLEERRPSFLPL